MAPISVGAILNPQYFQKEKTMNKTYALVKEFHETFRAAVGTKPSLSTGFETLRVALIAEEVNETLLAVMTNDEVEFADGLGDLDYVIEGAAITFGITLEGAEAHRAAYKDDNYLSLIGHLVIGVRHLNEYLHYMDEEIYDEAYRVKMVRAALTGLKALVWEIAERAEIPLADIIDVIHESNMSKLGADGLPIFREDGKVLKGPGFFTPTAKIKELLGV